MTVSPYDICSISSKKQALKMLEIEVRKLLNAQYDEAYTIVAGYVFSFTTVYGLRFSFTS